LIHRAETIQTFQEDGSAMGRIQAWGVAWNVALTHPFGAGFNFDADAARWMSYTFFRDDANFSHPRAAHSIYFQILGEHGFVGLILFLTIVISTYRTFAFVNKNAAAHKELRWMSDYAGALQIGTIGYTVSGAFLSLAYFDL